MAFPTECLVFWNWPPLSTEMLDTRDKRCDRENFVISRPTRERKFGVTLWKTPESASLFNLWVNNSEPYGRSDIRSEIAKKSSELIAARNELTGNKNRFLIKLNYLVLRRQNATQQRIIQDQRTEIAAAARRCNDLQIYLSEKVQELHATQTQLEIQRQNSAGQNRIISSIIETARQVTKMIEQSNDRAI